MNCSCNGSHSEFVPMTRLEKVARWVTRLVLDECGADYATDELEHDEGADWAAYRSVVWSNARAGNVRPPWLSRVIVRNNRRRLGT